MEILYFSRLSILVCDISPSGRFYISHVYQSWSVIYLHQGDSIFLTFINLGLWYISLTEIYHRPRLINVRNIEFPLTEIYHRPRLINVRNIESPWRKYKGNSIFLTFINLGLWYISVREILYFSRLSILVCDISPSGRFYISHVYQSWSEFPWRRYITDQDW
jgi:hypothetical protein